MAKLTKKQKAQQGKIDSTKDLDADGEKVLDAAVLEFKKSWA